MSQRRSTSASDGESGGRKPLLMRPKVWAGALLLATLALGSHLAWRHFAPAVARHPQYQITAERIHLTPPPPWIRSDVKLEVLRDAGLVGTVSVLDAPDTLVSRLQTAFEFHPWVASVLQIRKRLPAAIEIDVEYRRPVAAVETADGRGILLTPIDVLGTRLPEEDFTDLERRYLPRISSTSHRPLIGDTWEDPRVIGAARLAAGLADVWQQLRLVQILPATQPSDQGEEQVYSFEIITSGGTRIVWGAAPNQESAAGESPFATKRERLLGYAAQHGQLDSIDGPARLDVRTELVVTPRTARRKSADAPDKPVDTKTK
jgi:hypothetical protein